MITLSDFTLLELLAEVALRERRNKEVTPREAEEGVVYVTKEWPKARYILIDGTVYMVREGDGSVDRRPGRGTAFLPRFRAGASCLARPNSGFIA